MTAYFLQGCRPRQELRVGIEVEKPAVFRENGRTVRYNGKRGYKSILQTFINDLGWEVLHEDDGYPVQLQRGETVLSLETSGMIEFAGTTHQSLHELAVEARLHAHELREISDPLGIKWLGLGIQPVSHRQEHEKILRSRYRMLFDYFKSVGDLAASWALKCSSIQVNIDFTSRQNLERKFRLLTRVSPILSAMFCNSIINNGKLSHSMSTRNSIAQRADPPRFNPPKEFFHRNFRVESFIEYALDLPMVYIVRDGKTIRVRNLTFRKYLEKGFKGHQATMEDFEIHISFVYTDVRMKKYIEFRAIDGVPPSLIPSAAAVVKGIIYNKNGWDCIEELTKNWTYEDYVAFREDTAKNGLQASVRNVKALDLAKEVLEVASDNLRRTKRLDIDNNDESIHLEPIKEYVFVREKSPAEYVASVWDAEWHKSIVKLIDWSQY